ncbi:response regulator receiver domain protein [delta proteobacterium NaphS2]|nr:response regulator receiver domain protein [delta proteobacterium NaphS2]
MSEHVLLDGKKILIVDDEEDILENLEELLEMCQVVKASSFEEAKNLLETEPFDMAILDIMGVDGFGLLKIANSKGIPAVMLTAYAFTPGNLMRSVKEGADSYLPKEEMADIAEFLDDILVAHKKGKNPWDPWQKKLPSSYFEKRWGTALRDKDENFWETFKAIIKARKK